MLWQSALAGIASPAARANEQREGAVESRKRDRGSQNVAQSSRGHCSALGPEGDTSESESRESSEEEAAEEDGEAEEQEELEDVEEEHSALAAGQY